MNSKINAIQYCTQGMLGTHNGQDSMVCHESHSKINSLHWKIFVARQRLSVA